MLMTPAKFIMLRLWGLTAGRFPLMSALLRRVLVRKLVRSAAEPYVQSARFFSWDDFRPDTDRSQPADSRREPTGMRS